MRTEARSAHAAREAFSAGLRPGTESPSYARQAADHEVLHLTGPVLTGPEQEISGAWVVGGRIHHERPELPAGTAIREIDGVVVPGLADLHCHIGISDEGTATSLDAARAQARTDRDTGVLLIRDAGSITDTAPLQGEGDLPRIIRAGRHVARTRRYLIGYAHEVDPADLPATVAAEAERGDGWVKLVGDWIDRSAGDLTPTWSGEDFRAAAEAAHAHGARITTHTFDEETLPLVLDAGFDCLEHATGLTAETISRAAAAGVPVVTTLVNVDEFETYASQGERKFPAYAAHMRRLRAARHERTRDAHDAGVQLLTGTDAGGVLGHGIIHDELDALAACGLDATAILEAATWAPRAYLGVPGLEDGAPADLLVLPGDPRTDHRVLRERRHVVLAGRVVA
ncbi:amidohydrolase family protein [Brachybacterium sp. NBEC-018]|uniref:amidohydrolase family protein n=1 Tax=Brachybacterium sp. NBEC-018 TaxID=2996004 RepID=UPI0021751C89|nr:amidohydrolase family protein [Brachybacterium sp. NBEC-018]UVY83526.1 amidohydrolase family protein [Brachybacterium sp. NBEC-018]